MSWRLRPAIGDLVIVAVVTVAAFVSAAQLELHEVFSSWATEYERWQVDELPATLLVFAAGLSWFGIRRWREAQVEIERRIEIEQRMRELLRRNHELSRRLIEAQEQERRALARELHDELAQTCNAIHVEAACIINSSGVDRDAAITGARRIVDAAEGLYRLVHDMLRRLRPAVLDSVGLAAAIRELCESCESRSGIACRFAPAGVPEGIGEPTSIALYRIVQEALSNVVRHAGATRADVSLRRLPRGRAAAGRLLLTVQDDGRGMDTADAREGLGLAGMRERAAALGGRFALEAAPGRGVRLEVVVPLSPIGPR